MIRIIKNVILCTRFPFLKIFNNKTQHYFIKTTWLDYFPIGWKKAFGKYFCRDIKKKLIEENLLESFEIIDTKVKYGELRIYTNATFSELLDIIYYYEQLSKCYCENCGKNARYITRKSWVQYLCEECYCNYTSDTFYTRDIEDRLNLNDIPKYSNKFTPYISIDYMKMWGLINDKK